MAKQGADWRIAAPVDARADFGAVEGIIGRLNTTPMKSITVGRGRRISKEYGLDKPAATVRVTSGSAQAGLAIGKSAGDGVVYAKDLSRPMVFTVESALLRRAEEARRRLPRQGPVRRAVVQHHARRDRARRADDRPREGKGQGHLEAGHAGGQGGGHREGRGAADGAVERPRHCPSSTRTRSRAPGSRRPSSPSPSRSRTARNRRRSPSGARAPTPTRGATATPPPRRSTRRRSRGSSRRSTR